MLLSITRLIRIKKNAWRHWRTRERQNHVTIITNCRSLPPHTDILHDVIQQDGRPILPHNNNKVLMYCGFTISQMFLVIIIKELAHLILFYYSELRMFLSYLLLRKSCAINETAFRKFIPLDLYFIFNPFEEIPTEMWMRYIPSIPLIKGELNCFTKSKCLL